MSEPLLDAQDTAGVIAIWITPASDDVEPSVSIETLGGPKAFLRYWPRTGVTDWGWVVHESAVRVWTLP